MKRLKEDAFTMTELVVVVAIIGILTALLLPVLSKAKARAQRTRCVSNLNQLGIGLGVILGDDHAYPLYRNGSSHGTNFWWKIFWFYRLEVEGIGISNPTLRSFGAGVWHCPTETFPPNELSYGYNTFGDVPAGTPYTNRLGLVNSLELMGHVRASPTGWIPLSPIAESEVVDPSEMMAIGDTFEGILSFIRWDNFVTRSQRWHAPSRHDSRLNVVFCDGHVESPTLESLFENTNDDALARWNRDHQPHKLPLQP